MPGRTREKTVFYDFMKPGFCNFFTLPTMVNIVPFIVHKGTNVL